MLSTKAIVLETRYTCYRKNAQSIKVEFCDFKYGGVPRCVKGGMAGYPFTKKDGCCDRTVF